MCLSRFAANFFNPDFPNSPPRKGIGQGYLTSLFLFNIVLKFLGQLGKRNNRHLYWGKRKQKLFLFTDEFKNYKKSTKNLPIIFKFHKVAGHKIDTQKSIIFYTLATNNPRLN